MRVIDSSMVQGLERYLKSAIVDRHPSVSCAALVSSYHLYFESRDTVKRWGNEMQEAINMRPSITQSSPILWWLRRPASRAHSPFWG